MVVGHLFPVLQVACLGFQSQAGAHPQLRCEVGSLQACKIWEPYSRTRTPPTKPQRDQKFRESCQALSALESLPYNHALDAGGSFGLGFFLWTPSMLVSISNWGFVSIRCARAASNTAAQPAGLITMCARMCFFWVSAG